MYKYNSFDEALERLEEIVDILEKGECKLEDAARLFSEGVELAAECNSRIDNAKQTLTKLSEITSPEGE